MADRVTGPIGWERALMAAEKVKERLRRANVRHLGAAGLGRDAGERAHEAR